MPLPVESVDLMAAVREIRLELAVGETIAAITRGLVLAHLGQEALGIAPDQHTEVCVDQLHHHHLRLQVGAALLRRQDSHAQHGCHDDGQMLQGHLVMVEEGEGGRVQLQTGPVVERHTQAVHGFFDGSDPRPGPV